jgi:hypothetical protein
MPRMRSIYLLLVIVVSIPAGCSPVDGTAPRKPKTATAPRDDRARESLRGGPHARVVGAAETVFDWSKTACERDDSPDAPTRAFRDYRGRVHLTISRYVNREMVGPDLNHLSHSCKVTMRSHLDSHPSRFDDREWIVSTYTPNGRRVYALIHDEYHGHEHPGRCPSGQYDRCWYNAVTLAISRNGGESFRHARPPPTHLVASLPYRYVPERGPFGVFSPSNIILNPADRYYYAMVQVRQYLEQPNGSCLMRTRHLAVPRSWRAWDGARFSVKFANPYLRRRGSARRHICQPVSPDQIRVMAQSLTYNTYFKQFLLVGRTEANDPRTGRVVSGAYFSLSDDLIHWSERQLVIEAELMQTFECGDKKPIGYPVVLDPSSSSRNFATTGQRVYLYFTRFNYRACQPTPDRDLIRIPIEFSK